MTRINSAPGYFFNFYNFLDEKTFLVCSNCFAAAVLARHVNILMNDLRFLDDEFKPEEVHERLRKKANSVPMVAVIEHLEKSWPDVVDVRRHQQFALKDQGFAPSNPVRGNKEQDGILDPWVLSKHLGKVERLAKVRTPFNHRLLKYSRIDFLRQGFLFEESAKTSNQRFPEDILLEIADAFIQYDLLKDSLARLRAQLGVLGDGAVLLCDH